MTAKDAPPVPATAAGGWGPLEPLKPYRRELGLFAFAFFVLAMFSSQRFFRQSEAPHFVYQAKAFLEGRLDIDPQVLPNLEDWACVRDVGGVKQRCTRPLLPGDRWYSSFPAFPAVVMLPFVAVQGYQFNDTSFGVLVGALALVAFYRFLRRLGGRGESEDVALALLLGFGSLFFSCAIRGEVWFSAEVMGVAFTSLYAMYAVGASRPALAGVFFSMAVLTRTPLLFTGVFFVLEALRLAGPLSLASRPSAATWKALRDFTLGALPLAVLGAAFNVVRFGSPAEFGHRFFFENRVNQDIDTFGLFHPSYFARNFQAAFLLLPDISFSPPRLAYSPWGLSLLLTFPLLLLLLAPREKSPLRLPLLLTALACALPGLFYQNTGYMQFGFRFSLDYTPYLVALVAVSGWRLSHPLPLALASLGVAVNVWGAVAFKGYTEYVRHW